MTLPAQVMRSQAYRHQCIDLSQSAVIKHQGRFIQVGLYVADHQLKIYCDPPTLFKLPWLHWPHVTSRHTPSLISGHPQIAQWPERWCWWAANHPYPRYEACSKSWTGVWSWSLESGVGVWSRGLESGVWSRGLESGLRGRCLESILQMDHHVHLSQQRPSIHKFHHISTCWIWATLKEFFISLISHQW